MRTIEQFMHSELKVSSAGRIAEYFEGMSKSFQTNGDAVMLKGFKGKTHPLLEVLGIPTDPEMTWTNINQLIHNQLQKIKLGILHLDRNALNKGEAVIEYYLAPKLEDNRYYNLKQEEIQVSQAIILLEKHPELNRAIAPLTKHLEVVNREIAPIYNLISLKLGIAAQKAMIERSSTSTSS
jgi:hypothetical protein